MTTESEDDNGDDDDKDDDAMRVSKLTHKLQLLLDDENNENKLTNLTTHNETGRCMDTKLAWWGREV